MLKPELVIKRERTGRLLMRNAPARPTRVAWTRLKLHMARQLGHIRSLPKTISKLTPTAGRTSLTKSLHGRLNRITPGKRRNPLRTKSPVAGRAKMKRTTIRTVPRARTTASVNRTSFGTYGEGSGVVGASAASLLYQTQCWYYWVCRVMIPSSAVKRRMVFCMRVADRLVERCIWSYRVGSGFQDGV